MAGITRFIQKLMISRLRPNQPLLIGLLLAALLLCSAVAVRPGVAAPQLRPSYSASEVIALVNQLRAANRLPPYKVNDSLMAAAQSHSDWQASTGTTSHTGSGGSTPKGRAIAYGYGGGQSVFVSENIASGTSMTAAIAVQMWQGDDLHLTTMLSPYYTDVGAGVASAGGTTYFTLDAGYVAGQAGTGGSAPAATSAPGGTPAAGSGAGYLAMVITDTPMPDGSIIHTVKPGEVLINIAKAYGVSLAEIYRLNNYNDKTVIYPGEKVKIKGPDPTPTSTATPTATDLPTRTPRPMRTLRPTGAPGADESLTPLPAASGQATPAASQAPDADPLLIAILALMAAGGLLVVIGTVFRGRNRP